MEATTHFWWHSGDSAFTKSFDKGGQAGMKNVLQQYQTQCHNDHHDNDNVNVDTGMCSGLGKDAASEIAEKYAEDHCPNYSRPVTSIFQKKYKEECFEIGLDDCKGAINDEVYLYCGRYIDDYSVLKGLKFKCGYKGSSSSASASAPPMYHPGQGPRIGATVHRSPANLPRCIEASLVLSC
eukprot:2805472-Prorocentrum_lima.AAC.1